MKSRSRVLVTALFAISVYAQAPAQRPVLYPGPHPVRNDVAQPGQEVVTIRYFRIKKGTFDQFLKASQEGVWPFFNKMGVRMIGMWKVVDLPGAPGPKRENPGYDEVYLATRYASLAHWQATREDAKLAATGRTGRLAGRRSICATA
ncbi:MAG TPA: hypothetical protein VEF06_00815 [Bryobacteraceae bacterium]|nr:hypothetical protein [Bryobacteraceae bacterium]